MSSIFSVVSTVPALDGVGDDRRDVVAVAVDEEHRGIRHPRVDAVLQCGIRREPFADFPQGLSRADAQPALGVGEGGEQSVLRRVPRLGGEGAHAGAVEERRLGVLELGARLRVVLQAVGEAGEVPVDRETGRMLRIGLHGADELHGLVVGRVVDEPVRELRHPSGQPA